MLGALRDYCSVTVLPTSIFAHLRRLHGVKEGSIDYQNVLQCFCVTQPWFASKHESYGPSVEKTTPQSWRALLDGYIVVPECRDHFFHVRTQ